MKRLIVNADDLGADEARNAGIFKAIEAGTVTSVSILANGAAIEDAVSRILSLEGTTLSAGIHFNLSEGKPLSNGLRHIAGADGCFLGKQNARNLFLEPARPEVQYEICMELQAQLALLWNAGIRLDHLDGHQHVHIFPAVLETALSQAGERGIRWIRIPDEPPAISGTGLFSKTELEEAAFFSSHAKTARLRAQEAGFSATDNFRGLLYKGKLPSSYWTEFLNGLPGGLTELMVHPGYAADPRRGPFSGFSTSDREGELNSLTDGRFRVSLANTGVEITGFPLGAVQR